MNTKVTDFHSIILRIAAVLVIAVLVAVCAPKSYAQNQFPELQIPGQTEGTGTHFEIIDSKYLNITLDSSESIKLRMESVPEMMTMMLEKSVSTLVSQTQITISGFSPSTPYYKFEDNYHNLTQFHSDENGKYTYTQDLSKRHFVFIQPRMSTKFIKDDSTGGNCISIGDWDTNTKTCTLTTDVNESTQIDNDDIILDCNGHKIRGAGWTGYGIYLSEKSGINIKNCTVSKFSGNIALWNSSNNTLVNNTIMGDWQGVRLDFSSNNNIINNNIINHLSFGIYLYSGNNNKIYHNNFIRNGTLNAPPCAGCGAQVIAYGGLNNLWDNGYPNGGNYWSDFDTPQKGCNDLNADGICDAPYIFLGGRDNYPWTKQDGWKAPLILDVPKFYQNATSTLSDPNWPAEIYDFTNKTISQKGCALTSLAMILNYHGATTTPDTYESTNPFTLNEWLKGTSGYAISPKYLGNILWEKIDNYSNKVSYFKLAELTSLQTFDCTRGNLDWCKTVLDNDLIAGRPVIIYTRFTTATSTHFVVATGKIDDSWYINDPLKLPPPRITPTKLSDYPYGNIIFGLRRFIPEPTINPSFIYFYLASPAELIVIDSQGRKTGFDPTTQTYYYEISNAVYYEERLDNDETGEPGIPIKVLNIGQPGNGIYTLQVIGIDSGSYELGMNASDMNGSSTIQLVSGVTKPNFVSEYTIDYTSTPGVSIPIEHHIIIPDIITEIEIGRSLNLIDNEGIKNSLVQKLKNAEKKLNQNQTKAAVNILRALINEIKAQSGKHINSGIAAILIEDVKSVSAQMNLLSNSQIKQLSFLLANLYEVFSDLLKLLRIY